MAAERSQVRIYDDQPDNWKYPGEVAKKLGWDANQVQNRKPMPQAAE
jgi:hypothetical protein